MTASSRARVVEDVGAARYRSQSSRAAAASARSSCPRLDGVALRGNPGVEGCLCSYLGAPYGSVSHLAPVDGFDAWSNGSNSICFLSYTPAIGLQFACAAIQDEAAGASVHRHWLGKSAVRGCPSPRRAAAPQKMGNDVAKNCANRMAIGAMSDVTDLERPVIQRMSEKLAILREGSKIRDEGGVRGGIKWKEITQSDRAILDRIFVMLDRTGEDRINHKEFIVGIVPFALGKPRN